MTKEEIKNLFMQGIDCSQVVTGAFAEKMGMTEEQARKVSSCFGGGMMCGETCGAVTGALMVIGMVYGHSREGDQSQKEIMAAKTGEFKKLFGEKYSSCICRELLGHDISKPGEMEKVLEKGLMFDFCPRVVEDTIDILEKIL
ncbi:MAG TPA: C-GCAxxG-C-C family protein [Candidatus Dorea stercoravium]|nr:C-GCAxxG-C-C family protein [Candidatus Dorea stercoravium]